MYSLVRQRGLASPWPTIWMYRGTTNPGFWTAWLFWQLPPGENPLGSGNKVVVVGGGNVAMDAARTALRNGAEVDIVYRRREVDMPVDPQEIMEAKAEGAILIPHAIPWK